MPSGLRGASSADAVHGVSVEFHHIQACLDVMDFGTDGATRVCRWVMVTCCHFYDPVVVAQRLVKAFVRGPCSKFWALT